MSNPIGPSGCHFALVRAPEVFDQMSSAFTFTEAGLSAQLR
jgi:hypothetical protein